MKLKVNFDTLLCEERRLDFCPEHYTKTGISKSDKTIHWVYENTKGRFSFYIKKDPLGDQDDLLTLYAIEESYFAFEDPHEAVLCELTWS
jgi:hypothetical protein